MKTKIVLLLSALMVTRVGAQDSTHTGGQKFVDRADGVSFAIYDDFELDPVLHHKYVDGLPPGVTGFILVNRKTLEQITSSIINRDALTLDSISWNGHAEAGISAAGKGGFTDLIDRSTHWSKDAAAYVFVVFNPKLRQYQYTACKGTTVGPKRKVCVNVRTPKATGYADLLDRIVIGAPAGSNAGG